MSFSVLIIFFVAMGSQELWYNDFIDALQKKDIQSYRLLSIWVQGDHAQTGTINPIGGNPIHFKKWKKAMERFLNTAHQQPNLKIVVELIVDEKTRKITASDFELWQQRYPGHLLIKDLEDFSYDHQIQEPLKQCTDGIASVCSDFLRTWYLHQDAYEMNVYIDIDKFTEASHGSALYKSSDIFGVNIPFKGLFNSFSSGSGQTFAWNGDVLIDAGRATDWSYIKTVLLENFNAYEWSFIDMRKRKERLALPSFSAYLNNLDERTAWFCGHQDLNFNQNSIILDIIGPRLWLDFLLKRQSYPYEHANKVQVKQYMSWQEDTLTTSGQPMSYDLLRTLVNEEKVINIIKLTLMNYDYLYFKKRDLMWLPALKKAMLKISEDIFQDQEDNLMMYSYLNNIHKELLATNF